MKHREIKFRAWHTRGLDEGKMITEVIGSNNGTVTGVDSSDILMQFTGLHDKNGKEIYEGDIVEKRNFTTGITQYYTIIWSDGDCGFIGKGKTDSLFNGLGIISKDLEVIGNIYENSTITNSKSK